MLQQEPVVICGALMLGCRQAMRARVAMLS